MSSNAQITANRANAQHSTGPVTPEGKARVSQNALKHGLTARHLVIRENEHEEFAALRDSLTADLDPQGAIEVLTFHELLHAAWNLQRFRRLEAEVSIGTMDDLTDPQTAALLERLGRYQARAQRAWYRALAELRALQTNRVLRAAAEPDLPALVDIARWTKQTQSKPKTGAPKPVPNRMEVDAEALLAAFDGARRGENAPIAR